jgi:hypothetical protein
MCAVRLYRGMARLYGCYCYLICKLSVYFSFKCAQQVYVVARDEFNQHRPPDDPDRAPQSIPFRELLREHHGLPLREPPSQSYSWSLYILRLALDFIRNGEYNIMWCLHFADAVCARRLS